MASLGLSARRARKRLLFLVMRSAVRLVGFRHAGALGRLLASLHLHMAWRQRKRIRRDMAIALGRSADDPRTERELREAWRTNTGAVVEILAMFDQRQDPALLTARCELEGIEHLREALRAGRGAILLGAHMGNGAMIAVRLAAEGWPVSVVYKQSRMMSAGFFERGFALYGFEGLLANEGMKAYAKMLGALRRGGVVFLMADQGVKKAADGVQVRFLGKDMSMPAGPAQLAKHARAPVLPFTAITAGPRWRFLIGPPVVLPTEADVAASTRTLIGIIEQMVLAHPHLWSWPHRRWRLLAPGNAQVSA